MNNRQTCSKKRSRIALGKVLKSARGTGGITQAQIAKALKITQPAVSYLEEGSYVFPLDRLFDLADAYQVPLLSLVNSFGKKIGK